MILVLENDRSIRETLGLLLDHLGYEYKLASTCEEAIEVMKAHCPVTFIVDMLLDGEDATRAIQYCKNAHKDCKTILLTAMHRSKAEQVVSDLQLSALLSKPFDIEALSGMLT